MSELATKKCQPIKPGTAALSAQQIQMLLKNLSGWQQVGNELVKTFVFKNYYETMAFVNATAWLSHREDHHPDLEVAYNRCKMRYSTHSVGGLSENDFICAAKVDLLST